MKDLDDSSDDSSDEDEEEFEGRYTFPSGKIKRRMSLLFGISKRSGDVTYGIMVLPHIVTKMRATKRFIKLINVEIRRVRWRARRYS